MSTPDSDERGAAERRHRDVDLWAPPGSGVAVERRDPWELTVHGARAGLLAGLALGATEILASTVLRGDPRLPFDFPVAILVGPQALRPSFPLAESLVLGTLLHVVLSVVLGVAFLTGLALTYQLSARPLLVLLYGVLFGFLVWEVDFLALLPLIAPNLTRILDVTTQLWNGIGSHCLIYGLLLAAYVVRVRPGVLDRWWTADGATA
jgi:hypothetical protein